MIVICNLTTHNTMSSWTIHVRVFYAKCSRMSPGMIVCLHQFYDVSYFSMSRFAVSASLQRQAKICLGASHSLNQSMDFLIFYSDDAN